LNKFANSGRPRPENNGRNSPFAGSEIGWFG
jgi:hypothetical protein